MSVLGKIFGLRDGGLPTVPTPVGYPATSPPQKPRLRGLSSEDRKRALEGYHAAMRAHFAAIAKFQRERREKAGASSYKWVAISGACCDIAQANAVKNGKVKQTEAKLAKKLSTSAKKLKATILTHSEEDPTSYQS